MIRIAICHPTDPVGHVPGGIDSIIRGILKWAPPDLCYTLLGATSDPVSRPVGQEYRLPYSKDNARFLPLTAVNASAKRARIPLTVRYMWALSRHIRAGACSEFDVLDFHRVEPLLLFRGDRRAKNIIVHHDMSVIRDKNCDIAWRHAPAVYEHIERRLFQELSHVFTVRQTAVERYRKIYPNLASQVSFLPTWVDTTVFYRPKDDDERSQARAALLGRLGIEEPARVLVFVGRLDKQKDPQLMLAAFRQATLAVPELHLVIIGDGILRSEVERSRGALGLANQVTLLGAQPAHIIAEIHRGADLFFMTSAYEGMPIAVLEALATGLPVVSTNVGEIPLVVKNGTSGQLSEERSTQSVAGALLRALERLAEMRGAPCEQAVAPYRPERILNKIYDNHRAEGAKAGV